MTPSRRAAIILVLSAAMFRVWLFAVDFAKDLIGFEWIYTAMGWIVKLAFPLAMATTVWIGIAEAQPPKWLDRALVLVAAAVGAIIFFFPA